MSSLDPNVLLHRVIRRGAIVGTHSHGSHSRADVSDPSEPMQVAFIDIAAGTSFPAHIHRPRETVSKETQEAWVVIDGEVEVTYFDLDGAKLQVEILHPGDCSITYRGGHGYACAKRSLVYEFKTGEYLGSPELDKEMI